MITADEQKSEASLRSSSLLNLDKWHAKPVAGLNIFGGLDGIRGIAILLVVTSHCVPVFYMDTTFKKILSVLGANGLLAVWMFFVLSGFLISLPFFRRLQRPGALCPPGYALRRAAKVIPPLYLSILLIALLLIVQFHNWTPLRGALETMMFLHVFLIPNPVISQVYWSLAAEVSFYVLLPLLILVLRPPLRRWPWILALVFMAISNTTWLAVADHPMERERSPFAYDVLVSFVFFGWGTLFSCFHLAWPKFPARWSGPLALAGLVGFMITCSISTHYWLEYKRQIDGPFSRLLLHNAVGASAFLMLFVVYNARSLIGNLFSFSPLVLAGLISYEWYLFHPLFVDFSMLITGRDLHGSFGKLFIRIFFAFPVSIVFSMLVYRLYSLPILRWAHRIGG